MVRTWDNDFRMSFRWMVWTQIVATFLTIGLYGRQSSILYQAEGAIGEDNEKLFQTEDDDHQVNIISRQALLSGLQLARVRSGIIVLSLRSDLQVGRYANRSIHIEWSMMFSPW